MLFKRKSGTVKSLREAFEKYLAEPTTFQLGKPPHREEIKSLEINPAQRIFKVNGKDVGKYCRKYSLFITQDGFTDIDVTLERYGLDELTIYEYENKPKNADISINIK